MSGSDAWLALASGLCCAVAGALFAQRVRRLRPDVDLRSVLRATAAPWVAFGCMVAATGAGLAFEVDRDLAWRLPDLVELHFLAFAGAAAFGPAGFLFGFTVHLSFVVGHRRRWPLAAGALGTFLAAGLAWAVATRPIAPDLGSDVTPEGYVLQTSGESCAAASAANVARQLGFATTEREMAERLGTTKLGTSPAQVIAGLAELGVVCQRINREDPDPSKVAQPAVLFVDHRETGPESHAVAFLGMARGRALVVDPLYGLHPMTPAKLRARWHGRGLECRRP
jgi:hypothetical protein